MYMKSRLRCKSRVLKRPIVQVGGYFFRSQSHDDVRRVMPFVIQNLLILAAPPFLAASIFMSPGRIAKVLESRHFLASPRLLPKLFILVDVICLVTQAAGAILSGSEDVDQAKQGEVLIQVGLIIQLIAFCLFVTWVAFFHRRLNSSSYDSEQVSRLSWRRVLWGLYAVSFLFMLRSITRLIEYRQGVDGPLLSNEVYLYMLDAAVMWSIAMIFLVLHPGKLRYQSRRLTRKTDYVGQEGSQDYAMVP